MRVRGDIEQGLRRMLAAQPHESLPSERDLATRLGCARTTIRRALAGLQTSGALRRSGRVRLAHATMEQRPLLVISGDIDPDFSDRILSGVLLHGRRAGRHLLLAYLERLHPGLLAMPPAGVIRLDEQPHSGGDRLMASAAALGLPRVELGDRPGSTADAVVSDHAAGASILVDVLIARGCRRILQIGHAGLALRGWQDQRRQGYVEAMLRHGLKPLTPALTAPLSSATSASALRHAVTEMRAVLQRAWRGGACDAVMALNDHDAAIVVSALADMSGGESTLVTGYDARWPSVPGVVAHLRPPAFTIDPGYERIGEALTHTLLSRLEGRLPRGRQCRFIAPQVVAIA